MVLRFLSVFGSPLMREVWGGAVALRLEGAIVDLEFCKMVVMVGRKTLVFGVDEMRMVRNMELYEKGEMETEVILPSPLPQPQDNYFL